MSDITLTLFMIMKNESPIIYRCLDSVKKHVNYIVITDTGSTDDSVEKVEKYLVDNNIKGKVYKDEWKNFGHNRTNSCLNAKEWLVKEGIDLSRNFFITIDCDMKIFFKPEFKKEDLDKAESILITQVNSSLTYYNLRLFRSSLDYRCAGVTHEYWDFCSTNKVPNKTLKLDTIYIEDVGDGGSKADKFTRDIKLLTQGLEDEPNNHRYYFYLAQSYSDHGDAENAIKWYNKRIEAKGWVEELFISYLRLGELYKKIDKKEEMVYSWLKGYGVLPIRSETLFRLVNDYRNRGENHLAMMFLKTALKIPYPKECSLFIEHHVYNYKLLEELSIVGFYTHYRPQAFSATQYLLHFKDVPDYIKNNVLRNSFFYMKPFEWSEHKVLDLKLPDPLYKSSSSSLFCDGEEFYGTVRAVNYSISDSFQYTIRDPKNAVRTENYWLNTADGGKTFNFYKIRELNCPTVRDSHIKGLEDLKITWLTPDKPIGLAVDWERGRNNHPSIVLVHFDKESSSGEWTINKVVPVSYRDNECQKNWGIFAENENLYAIYSHNPLTILKLDINTGKEEIVVNKESSLDLSRIRGSSNPIKLPDGDWLVLVHEVLHLDTRKYFMRFMKYDKDWNLKGISYPFYIYNFFVEFSLSIIYSKEYIYIVFSTRDNTTEIVKVKDSNIKWLELVNEGVLDINNLYKYISNSV